MAATSFLRLGLARIAKLSSEQLREVLRHPVMFGGKSSDPRAGAGAESWAVAE